MIVLSGMSACGKDSIKRELVNIGMSSIVTYTTRPIRTGEVEGVDYHFISDKKFKHLISTGFFAEYRVYVNKDGATWYYGTPIFSLDDHSKKVLITTPEGLDKFQKVVSTKDWFTVYVTCPEDVVRERLASRNDNNDSVERRITADKKDFSGFEKRADCVIINDSSKTAAAVAEEVFNKYMEYMWKKRYS